MDYSDSPPSPGTSLHHASRSAVQKSGPNASSSPPPRSSSDSPSIKRRDSEPDTSTLAEEAINPTFDESILRALCDLDCGVPLLLDRIKQSMASCREASIFLKKRAVLEDEYGRSLHKLSQTTMAAYSGNDCKAGSFARAWDSTMKIHEIMGDNRVRFAARLNEMSDELASLAKEVDKNRKQTKELASRYERSLQESEMATEKAKTRFDTSGEELERLLVAKEGETMKEAGMHSNGKSNAPGAAGKRAIKSLAKGGMLLKGKNPASIQRQEEDVRGRMSQFSDAFRKALTETQTIRQEYFNFQLPRILRSLKESADELDAGMQFHLTRYAFLFESTVLHDGVTLVPSGVEDGPGLKPTMESIDNRTDFKIYMSNYAVAHGTPRGPRRDGPWDEGFLPPIATITDRPTNNPLVNTANALSRSTFGAVDMPLRPTFGVDLAEQMARDGVEIPKVMQKCCEAVERWGLEEQGIYRLSGTMKKVVALKEKLDRDIDSVDLHTNEWTSDINNVSSALKMWLRELPEPLITHALYQGFIDAAKIENDRLRHIRLHERVNDLPDANYATLKFLMGHLHKVILREAVNQMSVGNLAIVFGPTVFGQSPSPAAMGLNSGSSTTGHGAGLNGATPTSNNSTLAEMNFQCKAVETILHHYADIFVDESES